jgi:hypothetical protein
MMTEIVHEVWATVRQPKGDGDTGQVTLGFYTLADDMLTMTDSKGVPVRRTDSGEKIVHKMKEGDDDRRIASRLTLETYHMLRGETAATATGFGRAINYPKSGVC